MNATNWILALIFLLTLLPGAWGVEPDDQDSSYWMKKKLEYSQKVFASLSQADFDAIEESARMLAKLNQIEKFVRGRDQAYRAQLDIFRFAVHELRDQSEAKNIDGATLAFHQMTLSCVNCHKLLRGDAKKPKPSAK